MTFPALPTDGQTPWGNQFRAWADAIEAAAGGGSGVDPDDVGYDIILAAGQSNMWGQYGPTDPVLDVSDPRVFQWPASGGYSDPPRIIRAAEPVAHPETEGFGAPTGMGPALVFSRWLALSLPPNRRVLIVPRAVGASTLANNGSWSYPNGYLYTAARDAVEAALTAAGPNARFLGIIWLQGESDALNNATQAQYAAAFDAMIAGFRSEIPGATNARVVVAGMVPEFIGGTYAQIFAAHADTPNRVANSAYVPGPIGLQQGDRLHYTGAGQRILGKAMFYGGWLGEPWAYPDEPEVVEPPQEAEGFAEDTFAGRTVLGANWTGNANDVSLDGANMTAVGNSYSPFTHVAVPPSTSTTVRMDITPSDITFELGLQARGHAFYRTGNNTIGITQGYDILSPTPFTYESGLTYRHILTVAGTTATGKIQRLSDGKWWHGGTWNTAEGTAVMATVNAPAGVGTVGFSLYARTAGTKLANFKAIDASA